MRLERWSPESLFNNTKIFCRQSWIGVEGLPLNLWNEKIFRIIGNKCGGLLDVAKSTLQMSCLSHAQLKVKGNEGGFARERLLLSCWGKRTQLKLFSLNTRISTIHGDNFDLGLETREEEGADVAKVAVTALTEERKVNSTSADSDTCTRQQRE